MHLDISILRKGLVNLEKAINEAIFTLDLSKNTKFVKLINQWISYLDTPNSIDITKYNVLRKKVLKEFRRELDFNFKQVGSLYIEDSQDLLKYVRSVTHFLNTSAKSLKELERD